MSKFFDEKNESLVAYYLLPTLKISYKLFGAYFNKALISRDLLHIRVELIRGCKESYWDHEFYRADYDQDGKTYVLYEIPGEFSEDVKLFCAGKYSHMSAELKRLIYKHSGLLYNKQIDNLIVTDKRLLALSKSPILKQWVLDTYRIKSGKNSELIKLKNKDSIYYD